MSIIRNVILLLLVSSLLWVTMGCKSDSSPSGAVGEPTCDLSVDIIGESHLISVDTEGRSINSIALASTDGTVILSIDKGTRLVSKDGKPLSSILVKVEQENSPLADGARIIGSVYSLEPQDVTLNIPIKLTLSYNPEEIPEGVREDDIYIAPYDEDSGWGSYSFKRVEAGRDCVTTQLMRFTRYAILAPLKEVTPTPDLTSTPLGQALSNGKATLAEFGSSSCVPCKQMKPILEELAIEYESKLNVVIVEVYEQRELTGEYGIMAIPTQIVFDSSGNEVTRHIGLWPMEEIIAYLTTMGIE
ncbi:thioredoxin family protein [Chloroflexota bacterium]